MPAVSDIAQASVSATAEGEVLRQIQRQLELAPTPRGQGQITENERKLIREMVPVWANSPEGIQKGLSLLRQLDAYEAQIAAIYRRNAGENGGQPNAVTVRQQIADFVRSNPPPDVNRELSGYESPASDTTTQPPGRGWAIRPVERR